jgi:hypothetical protein
MSDSPRPWYRGWCWRDRTRRWHCMSGAHSILGARMWLDRVSGWIGAPGRHTCVLLKRHGEPDGPPPPWGDFRSN